MKSCNYLIIIISLLLSLFIDDVYGVVPGPVYINGKNIPDNGVVTLHNGGSVTVTAINSDYACIFLTDHTGIDWTGMAPECKWDDAVTDNIGLYCEFGDKYSYSKGTPPTFMPESQETKNVLKIQVCGKTSSDTHLAVRTIIVKTPVLKNPFCVPNNPVITRLKGMEHGDNNPLRYGNKKTLNVFTEDNNPYNCDGRTFAWTCKSSDKKGCMSSTTVPQAPDYYDIRSQLKPDSLYALPIYAFARLQPANTDLSEGVDAVVGSM